MATVNIDIATMAFPPNTPVKQGDTVTWTNKMSMDHTVTSDPDGATFDSGELKQSGSFSYTFSSAGSFPYHCEIHARMRGTITVS